MVKRIFERVKLLRLLNLSALQIQAMDLQVKINMNPSLYLRDPEGSELGKSIVRNSVLMIHERGFEDFTFKKLATSIKTTEASVYRYFENKHRLLTYITTWFWNWLEYQLIFHTNNIADASHRINIIIKLLTFHSDDGMVMDYVNRRTLHEVVIFEGDKSYLSKHVTQYNEARLYKPYKDLCHRIALIFNEYNPNYAFSHSLASTLIETAHHQYFFQHNLPSLTDFGRSETVESLEAFLMHMVYSVLDSNRAMSGGK